jgi:hypothetical protein
MDEIDKLDRTDPIGAPFVANSVTVKVKNSVSKCFLLTSQFLLDVVGSCCLVLILKI